jgi:hypothetical protein
MINLQKIQKPRREGREEKTKHKRESQIARHTIVASRAMIDAIFDGSLCVLCILCG